MFKNKAFKIMCLKIKLKIKGFKNCSIHQYLFCCLIYRVIVTIFLNSIYMRQYTVLVFPHFLIGLFVFLVLSCMNCLCILEINHLSVVSFAIIFSYSEGFLFTLLIVSSAVQKLLSLIRSHSFTFVSISITLEGGSQRILL